MHILESSCGGIILINHVQFGQGKDVIFLHGWGGDTRSFLGCAKAISSNFRVTLVDFYGFGKTPAPDYPLVLQDYADGVVEIIRHYKMSRVILVGHSFGGRVAIRIASKNGYLLDGIVLVDSAGIKPRRGIRYYGKVWTHKILTRLGISHRSGSEDYRKLSGVEKQTFKNIVNEDQTGELRKITLPVLLIWGDKDKDTPIYMAKRIYRRIPTSSLVIFRGEGHFAYLRRHRLFTEILRTFLSDGEYEVDYRRNNNVIDKRRVVKIPYLRAEE